nr:hypothetical protein [Abalone asfa-like virus]
MNGYSYFVTAEIIYGLVMDITTPPLPTLSYPTDFMLHHNKEVISIYHVSEGDSLYMILDPPFQENKLTLETNLEFSFGTCYCKVDDFDMTSHFDLQTPWIESKAEDGFRPPQPPLKTISELLGNIRSLPTSVTNKFIAKYDNVKTYLRNDHIPTFKPPPRWRPLTNG